MLNKPCRICQRVGIVKGLAYNGLDAESNVVDRYMGVAVNISQNGIQLETDRRIITEHILLMFFDFQGKYLSAPGKVIYSEKNGPDRFRTGIQFLEKNRDSLKFIKRLIQSYHYQKKVSLFVS